MGTLQPGGMITSAASSTLQRNTEITNRGVGRRCPLVSDQDLTQRSGNLPLLLPNPGFERIDRRRQRGPAHLLHREPDEGLVVRRLGALLEISRDPVRVPASTAGPGGPGQAGTG